MKGKAFNHENITSKSDGRNMFSTTTIFKPPLAAPVSSFSAHDRACSAAALATYHNRQMTDDDKTKAPSAKKKKQSSGKR